MTMTKSYIVQHVRCTAYILSSCDVCVWRGPDCSDPDRHVGGGSGNWLDVDCLSGIDTRVESKHDRRPPWDESLHDSASITSRGCCPLFVCGFLYSYCTFSCSYIDIDPYPVSHYIRSSSHTSAFPVPPPPALSPPPWVRVRHKPSQRGPLRTSTITRL